HNANKSSLTINMGHPSGREVVRRLVAVSHIVCENFRPGVMESWGMTYEVLREIRRDIIFARFSGLGHSGPDAAYGSAAPVSQGLSGVTAIAGLPDREPSGWGWGYMDNSAAYYGTMAMLLALYHREVTGEGQELEVAAVEAGVNLLGPDLLHFTANKAPYRR